MATAGDMEVRSDTTKAQFALFLSLTIDTTAILGAALAWRIAPTNPAWAFAIVSVLAIAAFASVLLLAKEPALVARETLIDAHVAVCCVLLRVALTAKAGVGTSTRYARAARSDTSLPRRRSSCPP
jgi:hypothetical protein